MRSPFLGMDPYLEGHLWPDVHQSLANAIKVLLVPKVRPKYLVRTNSYLISDDNMREDIGIMYPDVELLRKNQTLEEPIIAYGSAKNSEFTPPTILLTQLEPVEVKIPVVEIRDKNNNELIAAIEVLSPVNKRNPGLAAYRKKRRDLYKAGIHFLELDLLRRGIRPFESDKIPPSTYLITLVRANSNESAFWTVNIDQSLPVVPVPLKPEDGDIALDIGQALQRVYEESAYGDEINYQELPPPPRLTEKEQGYCRRIGVLTKK
ncbi:MAG: DUF4058 family protein [Bacteroidota bacterium]